MSSRPIQHYRQLQLLYRERGLAHALLHLARAVLDSIYVRQVQHIMLTRLDRPETALVNGAAEDENTECLVVESPEALLALEHEIPPSFRDSVDGLKERLVQGCVICLARRPSKDGAGKQVVGYEIAEWGVFSALGRRKAVAADVVFSHHAEVLREYRGQRIHALLFAKRDEYFRQRGGRVVCGALLPQNRSSLRALGRAGFRRVGAVQRISFLRGLMVWETPWGRIENALQGTDRGQRLSDRSSARPERHRVRDWRGA